MTEDQPKSLLAGYARSSAFQVPSFLRKNERPQTSEASEVSTSTSDGKDLVVPRREVPYGCFWNHSFDDDKDAEAKETAASDSQGTPAAGTTWTLTPLTVTSNQPSPTLSATSDQTTLAGDLILDSFPTEADMIPATGNKTSAFTLPMAMQPQRMQAHSNSRSLPTEIQLEISTHDEEGMEVEASPRHMIKATSTFDSLSSDGSFGELQGSSPQSLSTTSTSSIPSFSKRSLPKKSYYDHTDSGGKKVLMETEDQYGEIQQTHTETTVSTDTTQVSAVQVRLVVSCNDCEQEEAPEQDIYQSAADRETAMDKAHGNVTGKQKYMLDTSIASADDGDFFSEMLDSEKQPGVETPSSHKDRLSRINAESPANGSGTRAGAIAGFVAADPIPVVVTEDDPFAWAYDVWKRKGLMPGKPFLPPRVQVRPKDDMSTTPVKPTVARFDQDLSGVNELPTRSARKNRLSLPAVPSSAKKPGFGAILNRWQQKSHEGVLPTYLNSAQGRDGRYTSQEPKQHMGVRNQIIVASHISELERPKEVDEHQGSRRMGFGLTNGPPLVEGSVGLSMSPRKTAQSDIQAFTADPTPKPVSQASRLVSQLSKTPVATGLPMDQRRCSSSPPRNHQHYKANVQQILEFGSVFEKVSSRQETGSFGAHVETVHHDRKVAKIMRKSDPSQNFTPSSRSVDKAEATASQIVPDHEELKREPTPNRRGLYPLMPPIAEDAADDDAHTSRTPHQSLRQLVHDTPHVVGTNDSHETLATPNKHTPSLASPEVSSRLISSDSPWKALLKMDEESFELASKKEHDAYRPWNRDVVIHKTCKQSLSPRSNPDVSCSCSSSVFSRNDEMVEFMLPLMGMACTCGMNGNNLASLCNPEEPTSLENILRPWQCDFLAAFGIFRGDQLVKAHHRSANALASALRRYRKKHDMKAYPTESCSMALSIWSKTSKAFVRSIRKQLTSGFVGELKVPNTLYIISSFMDQMPADRSEAASDGSARSRDGQRSEVFDFAEL